MTAIVAKNKPGHSLVPQFGGLTFFTELLQRTLNCLHCSLCKTICLGVIGRSTSMIYQIHFQQLIEFSNELSATIRNYFCTAIITAQNLFQEHLSSRLTQELKLWGQISVAVGECNRIDSEGSILLVFQESTDYSQLHIHAGTANNSSTSHLQLGELTKFVQFQN